MRSEERVEGVFAEVEVIESDGCLEILGVFLGYFKSGFGDVYTVEMDLGVPVY